MTKIPSYVTKQIIRQELFLATQDNHDDTWAWYGRGHDSLTLHKITVQTQTFLHYGTIFSILEQELCRSSGGLSSHIQESTVGRPRNAIPPLPGDTVGRSRAAVSRFLLCKWAPCHSQFPEQSMLEQADSICPSHPGTSSKGSEYSVLSWWPEKAPAGNRRRMGHIH